MNNQKLMYLIQKMDLKQKQGKLFEWILMLMSKGFGIILGNLSRLFTKSTYKYWSNMVSCYHTARWRDSFKQFGKKSIICKNVKVINPSNIIIGDYTSVGQNSILESWHHTSFDNNKGEIIIGDNCTIGEYVHITATNKITIGSGVLTGRFVLITDNSHGRPDGLDLDERPSIRDVVSKGPVVIKDNVWIGDKVCIMSGLTIGKGAIIAANAVVTHDIPAYCLVAGVPAKIIKNWNK
jgi:acetyltransferase-like isoleucine patch superfamily enzyme